jgi:hypothetical protein
MMQSNVQWQTAIGIHLLNLILKDLHEGFNKDMRALCSQGSVQNESIAAGLESWCKNRAY